MDPIMNALILTLGFPFALVIGLFLLVWHSFKIQRAHATITNINLSAGSGMAAVGSILSVATPGSPITYRPVGNAGKQKWSPKSKTADTTNQGTNWTQLIATIRDGGTFTCELHFIPGSAAADSSGAFGHGFATGLGSFFEVGTLLFWELQFPNGTLFYFTGIIADFPIDMDPEKDLMVSMSISVSGQPNFVSV
jgi:hypothetical protein